MYGVISVAKERILIVEDEDDLRELIQYNLQREGFEVMAVASGEEALTHAALNPPALVCLDLMLPGMNGLDVCRTLKNNPSLSSIPVLMISAKTEETDVVTGLELGADDYITKPFSPKVLVARARAILRRNPLTSGTTDMVTSESISVHGLEIHLRKHEAYLHQKRLSLTATEFRILHFLSQSPGWVFTRQQIVETVHGDDYPVTERSIDVQVAGLRKKLGSSSDYIETVRGIGYRFKE